MFDFVRNNKRVLQFVLLLLILPSFVLVGVSQSGGAGADGVAEVAGKQITQQDWEEAQRKRLERDRAELGERFDPKALESAEAKQGVLDGLVLERALAAEIDRSKVVVTEDMLKRFYDQNFIGADGKFSLDRYRQEALFSNMTTKGLDADYRRRLSVQQVAYAIQGTAFAPRSITTRVSDLLSQEREVQEMMFPLASYADKVNVTDAMIKAFYDKNDTLFQQPEQTRIEYVVFSPAVVEKQVSVSEEEVAKFYAANEKSFTVAEQRFPRHILINAGEGVSAADKAAAKTRAQAILAEVKAAPASFAEIAKAKSEDTASAELGGELGVATADNLDPALLAAAAKLKEGEVSLVETIYGFHIMSLSKIVPGKLKSLDEAKVEIAAELKKQKMAKKYSEMAEQFSDMVYEQSDSLKPVADKLGLTIETASNVGRTPSPALGDAPVNNAKFLAAIFSAEVLKNKRNTEAVEVAPSTLAAGRVVEYKPASKVALADVAPVIRQRVAAEEALRLAKVAGDAKLAAIKASDDVTGFDAPKMVSRMAQPTVHPMVVEAVLKADVTKLPAFVGVSVPGMGYGVYRIGKVGQPAQADPARRTAEAQQIGSIVAQQEFYSYLESLKTKHKARVLVKAASTSDAK